MQHFKRHIALILVFILMFSNIGLALNMHFCGGEQVSTTLVYINTPEETCNHDETLTHQTKPSENETICCGSSDNHNDCCKDQTLKQDRSDLVATKAFSFSGDVFIFSNTGYILNTPEYLEIRRPNIFAYDKPAHAPPLYKLYCRLIYYA